MNLNRQGRSGDSVFKHVEESHSALFELDEERIEKEKRSLGEHHYAPTAASAKYLLLTPNFVGDVLHPLLFVEDIETADKDILKDRRDYKANKNGPWYLPVRFVAALAKNLVEWDIIQLGKDPDPKKSVSGVDDEDFIGDWEDEWCAVSRAADRVDQFYGFNIFVPLRAANGTLRAVRCKHGYKDVTSAMTFKDAWANSLETLLKVTSSSGSFRKFNRSVDVPLAHGLRFHILGAAITRFDTKDEARDALDGGITLIKGLKKPCAISAENLTQAVVEDKPNNEWMKLSTNPFGLYSTYVHRDDWNDYMRGLGPVKPGMTPIRRFRADASDELKAMTNKILAERPTADPNQIVALNNQNVPLERSQTAMSDEGSAIEEEGSDRETSLGKAQRTFVVPLSNAKRQAAVGQRKKADDQSVVMVGYTAPQIAHSLGWSWERDPPDPSKPSYQMPNSLYIAEWTHLNAFSYGGLVGYEKGEKNSEDKIISDRGKSGQIPLNLTVGTSETNSLMTRYESAWQNLLVKETELWKDTWGKEYSGKFEGRLYLHCNDPTAKLHFDMIDQEGRFSWDKILLRENDTKIDQGQPLANQPTLQEMIQVAQAHNSIVYTLKYGAYFPECHIWGGGVFQHTTKFYPFMRPFFHRVEKYMDNHLFAKMQELAVDKLKKSAVKVDNDNKGQSILNQGFAQISSNDPKGILGYRRNPTLKADSEAETLEKKLHVNPDGEMNDVVDNRVLDPMNVDMNGGGLFNNVNNFSNFNVGNFDNAGNIDLSTLHNLHNNLTQLQNQNNNNGSDFGGLLQQFRMDNGTNGSLSNGGSDHLFSQSQDGQDGFGFD